MNGAVIPIVRISSGQGCDAGSPRAPCSAPRWFTGVAVTAGDGLTWEVGVNVTAGGEGSGRQCS